jgi:hypothetical protein
MSSPWVNRTSSAIRPPAGRDASRADDEQQWISALRGPPGQRREARSPLHGHLLRAARFELDRIKAGRRARQGTVFSALALNAVSIDVLAERLHTTGAALCDTLRDVCLALAGAGYPHESDDSNATRGKGSTAAGAKRP